MIESRQRAGELDDPMIEQAWNEYRDCAKRARSLRAKTDGWNFWAMVALVAVIVTVLAGAAASYCGASGRFCRSAGSVAFGAAATSMARFAEAIAVHTAIAAAVVAFGLMESKQGA